VKNYNLAMNLTSVINEAVDWISSNEGKKQLAAEKLAPLREIGLGDIKSPEIPEVKFSYPIPNIPFTGKIGGVDSGFIDKPLAAVDIVLIRAVSTVFEYEKGVLQKSHYYPSLYHFPLPHLTNNALEQDEFLCSKSLLRLREEVKAAISILEKHSPEYFFLDGSIVPQYPDKPRKDSKVNELYREIIHIFQKLYETAEQNNCKIVGCVEDSRGSRIRTILQEEILSNENLIDPSVLDHLYDSHLLDYLLKIGERSFAFRYSKEISKHPILMDFKEQWGRNIYACYIKPVAFDKPLRIEFINSKGNITELANELASVVYTLSNSHREYAYPSVLIEADLRARLRPEEVEVVYNKIMDKLPNPTKLKMRRSNRPF